MILYRRQSLAIGLKSRSHLWLIIWFGWPSCGSKHSQGFIPRDEKWGEGMPLVNQHLFVSFGGVDAVAGPHVELYAPNFWVRERRRGLHALQMLFRFRDESFGFIPRDVTAENSVTS